MELVEQIETRYTMGDEEENHNFNGKHIFDLLMEIKIYGPPDLSERHDFYAHGKLED